MKGKLFTLTFHEHLQQLAELLPCKLLTEEGEILAKIELVAGLLRAANYYYYSAMPDSRCVYYCAHVDVPYWEMITDSWNLVYIFALSTEVSTAQFGKIVSAVKQPLNDYFLMVSLVRFIIHI